ncbi:hypothetical protein ACW9HC_32290 [Nocardia gipuzkoensis]
MAVTQSPGFFAVSADGHPHVFLVDAEGDLRRWTGKNNGWLSFAQPGVDLAQVPIAFASRHRDWLIGWTGVPGSEQPGSDADPLGDRKHFDPEEPVLADADGVGDEPERPYPLGELVQEPEPFRDGPLEPESDSRFFDLVDTVLGSMFNKTILHIFAMGTNGTLWCRYFDGYNWTPQWQNFGTGFAPVSPTVAVRRGKVNLWAVRPNGDLWERYNDGHNWSSWHSFSAPGCTSAASVYVWGDRKKMTLLAPRADGAVYERWFDGHNWSSWKPFGHNPDAVEQICHTRFHPVLVDRHGRIRDRYHDGWNWADGWGNPLGSGGLARQTPVSFLRGTPTQKYMYARGRDGLVWEWYQGSGGWQSKPWSDFKAGDISLACSQYTSTTPGFESGGIHYPPHENDERIDLFAIDTHGRLRHRHRGRNGWSASWADRGPTSTRQLSNLG